MHYIADSLLRLCDVLFVSETWLSRAEDDYMSRALSSLYPADLHIVQEFAMELPPAAGEGRPRGGVGFICRRQQDRTFENIICDDARLCGVTVLDHGTPVLSVLGCYMPYWDSSGANLADYATLTHKLDALITALRPSAPVMLVGDFNCALPPVPYDRRPLDWWRLRPFSKLSALMQDLLDGQGFTVAEFNFQQSVSFTYARAGGRSHIDHIAVSRSLTPMVSGCAILPPTADNLSPHLPIVCNLALETTSPQVLPGRRPDTVSPHADVLDWTCPERLEIYKDRLDCLLSESLPSCGDVVDDIDSVITSCIHAAARYAGCSKPWRPPKSWWGPEIAVARDRARFWYQLWSECGRPSHSVVGGSYRAARRAYRRARRAAAVSQIVRETRIIRSFRRDGNLTAFWRRVQRARRGGHPAALKCSATDFGNHFQQVHLDTREELSLEHLRIADAVEARLMASCNEICVREVSTDQVAALINRLHRGKSPGVDGVTAEHLQYGRSPALLAAVARLLTICLSTCSVPATFADSVIVPLLKKPHLDPHCLDNYRPITLTTCTSKLLELIMLDELKLSFNPSDLQFGFLDKRGTAQASLLAEETIQWNLSRQLAVFAANLDARKCFDKIWHDGMFYRLIEHLSINCWHLLVSWYRRLTARVVVGGRTSESLHICRGTRQGAILSPTLANIFLYPLIEALDRSGCGARLNGHHVPAVCYADDIFLVSTNARGLSNLLELVSNFAAKWRLQFIHPDPSKTKSHCIIFRSEIFTCLPSWELSGQQLQVRRSTEHLGSVLDCQFDAKQHIEARIKKACGAFYGLAPVGMFLHSLPARDKVFLWKRIVLPCMTFGCNTAPLSSADLERLDSRQANCIKAALGLPRRSHHSALLAALNLPRVHEVLRADILRTFFQIFVSNHRLRQAFISGIATLAINPSIIAGSFLHHVYTLCNKDFREIMFLASGHVPKEYLRSTVLSNGLSDSIKFLLDDTNQASRRLLRLLVLPQ